MGVRAAIVGGALSTALGDDWDSTWCALSAGRGALARWPSEAGWQGRAPWVALRSQERRGFEEHPTLRMLGRHGVWLEQLAQRAHRQAGFAALAPESVGLFVALGMVDSPPEELAPAVLASRDATGRFDLARFFGGGFRALHPLWPLAMLGNVAAGHVAIGLNLRGDNTVLASHADAGVRVLSEACAALAAGSMSAAVVGGVAEPVSEASLERRHLEGVLARDPHSAERGPLAPGEGGAILALESAPSAAARGTPVLGWLSGHGFACSVAPTAEARAHALVRAQAQALEMAGASRDDVELAFVDLPGPRWDSGGFLPDAGTTDAPDAPGLGNAATPTFATPRALGHLLGGAAALDVLLALSALSDSASPLPTSVRVQGRGRPESDRSPAARTGRALVASVCGRGGVGVVVVESPACAS